MFRPARTLRLFAFSLVSLVIVLGAEASQVVAESFLVSEENRMLEMVNEHRAERGLQQLELNDAYRWVARRHTQRMVARGEIYHNPNLRADADDAIPGWRMLGENVGTGPSVESVQRAFLRSEKHRANIEESLYNIAGIGGAAGPQGRRYFTQNFAQWNGPPATPTPPPPTPAVTPAPEAPPEPPDVSPESAPSIAPPPAPAVTPVPATPEPASEDNDSTVAAASLEDGSTDGPSDGDGRRGFFEVLFGLLTRFVQKLWIG